jgi:hypothetical protein
MPLVIRLWDGQTLPAMHWHDLEPLLAAADRITVPELRARIGAPDGTGQPDCTEPVLYPSCGCETCNWTIGRLWWHVRIPDPPRLCERRWRRYPDRTILDWQDWKAQPPDTPGGDWT